MVDQTSPLVSRPRRPRTAFFEEQRRQFGFGDFLSSALDNNNNTLSADPAKPSNFIEVRANPPQEGPPGTLTVLSRDPDDIDFVNITYVNPATNTSFGLTGLNRSEDPRTGNVTIGSTVQISNPQNFSANIGIPANGILPLNPTNNTVIIDDVAVPVVNNTVNINGQIVPVTIIPATLNGQPITSNVRAYNVGASYSGSADDPVSGVVLITNPDDPSSSFYIQLPPTRVDNSNDNNPVSGAAFLSIGRPTDR